LSQFQTDPAGSGFSFLPDAIKHLLVINGLVFVALNTPSIGSLVYYYGALFPIGSGNFMPWQILSYSFLHAGFGHIFFNMFALFVFGQSLERLWGTKKFVFYYFVTAAGGAILHMIISDPQVPTIGASGAVFGLLTAFGMVFPNRELFLLFIPFPVKAKYFVIGYGTLELINGLSLASSGIAHFAHLGGMVAGFILLKYWKVKKEH
jgi:membrane associated rhomboid family serine protease